MASRSPSIWTDEYIQSLISEFDALPGGESKAWFQKKQIQPPYFYKMRRRYLNRQDAIPRVSLENSTEKRSVGRPRKILDFREVTREQKLQLLIEYDHLLFAQKNPWKQAHGLKSHGDDAILAYYRAQFRKEGLYPKNGAPPPPAPSSTAVVLHNGTNGHHTPKQVARAHQINIVPSDIPLPTGVISLDDAILAMQVRMDHYNEFMAHLRNIQRGGRS